MVFYAIERFQSLSTAGITNHDSFAGQFIQVKRVGRLSQFEHHVVCDIGYVIYAALTEGFQPLDQPFGRRTNLHALYYSRHIPWAKDRIKDLYRGGGINICTTLFKFRYRYLNFGTEDCAYLSGYTQMTETVRTV